MAKYTKKSAETKEAAKTSSLVIQQPTVLTVALEITGTAPLIQNNFSQKTIEQMLRKHMGISVPREAKKPSECVRDATIYNQDGVVSVPPAAIKKAMICAAGQIKTFKKTHLRTQIYIRGGSIPITYERMEPRMDLVRTSGMSRAPDVRFRPMFEGWKARLEIEFSDMLNAQSVVDMLHRAGSIGLGEWRPEKDGSFGTFRVSRHISDPEEIDEVRAICACPLKGLKIPSWAIDADIDPTLLAKIASRQDEDGEPPEEDLDSGTSAGEATWSIA